MPSACALDPTQGIDRPLFPSARGDRNHLLSMPSHRFLRPVVVRHRELLPPDYIATLIQYLATLVCSCAVVALVLATVIERPVGPLVPDALQRLELVNIGARGLLAYAAMQLLAFAVVAGIKEECESVTLEIMLFPAPSV